VPDLESRGLLGIVRSTLVTGAPTVLAPAFHKYLIPARVAGPSSHYDQMQQRVAIGALVEGERATGLLITIEDVTERLELEHRLAGELREGSHGAERSPRWSPVESGPPLGDGRRGQAVRRRPCGGPPRSRARRRARVGCARHRNLVLSSGCNCCRSPAST
jgi:hypothetical protein